MQLGGPQQPNCSWVMVRCGQEAHLADPSSILSGNVLPFTNDIVKQHCWNPADHIQALRLSFPLCFTCLLLNCCVMCCVCHKINCPPAGVNDAERN